MPLMWNIRRKIDLLQLPKRKSVIQFIVGELRALTSAWRGIRPSRQRSRQDGFP
jgi:hypothetical protein